MRKLAWVSLVLAASCGRCGQPPSAKSAEQLLPPSPSGAVVTGELGTLAADASEVLGELQRLPGGEQLGEQRTQAAQLLGFDPFTRQGLTSAGIDPLRGAAVAFTVPQAGHPVWVASVPLADPGKFAEVLSRVLVGRAGFPVRRDEARGGVKAQVFERQNGGQRLAFAVIQGYGVVARGDDPVAELAAAAARTPEQSLAQAPRLAQARDALGPRALTVLVPPESGLATRLTGRQLPGEMSVGLSLAPAPNAPAGAPRALWVRAVQQVTPDQLARLKALFPGGPPLLQVLPADAPLTLQLGLAPAALPQWLDKVPQLASARAELGGADRQLFEALAPGVAATLSVSPQASLARAVDYGILDFRERSPFTLLRLAAVARVQDVAKARAALQALQSALPRIGAVGKPLPAGTGFEGFSSTYLGGEGLTLGLWEAAPGGPLLFALGGYGTPAEALQKADPPSTVSPVPLQLRLDLQRLAAQVHALPDATYGAGPQAYVTRSVVSQVIDPLSRVRGWVTLLPGDKTVTAELALSLAGTAQ